MKSARKVKAALLVSLAIPIASFSRAADVSQEFSELRLFRRDRLLLDIGKQRDLAKMLIQLSNKLSPKEQVEWTQCLLLAAALDPASGARDRLSRQVSETPTAAISIQELWNMATWLRTLSSPDSQTLANCLSDVLAGVDSNHPQAKAWKLNRQHHTSPWPELPKKSPELPPELEIAADVKPEETDLAPIPVKINRLHEAVGELYVMQRVPAEDAWSKGVMQLSKLTGQFSPRENFDFSVETSDRTWLEDIRTSLRKHHAELPQGKVIIRSENVTTSLSHHANAAVAVFADATITGIEKKAVILGSITPKGTYDINEETWESLQQLATLSSGQRILVPSKASDVLLAMLVAGKTDFFIRNEILVARDLEELIQYSTKKPTIEEQAIAETSFKRMQLLQNEMPLNRYLAMSHIRAQLEEISLIFPAHASARLLYLQASGKRPVTIPKSAAVAWMKEILSRMHWIAERKNYPDLSEQLHLEKALEKYSSELLKIEPYFGSENKPLLNEAAKLQTLFRSLLRSYRSKDVYYLGTTDIQRTYAEFCSAYERFNTLLGVQK